MEMDEEEALQYGDEEDDEDGDGEEESDIFSKDTGKSKKPSKK
jgi:hypothetical protein